MAERLVWPGEVTENIVEALKTHGDPVGTGGEGISSKEGMRHVGRCSCKNCQQPEVSLAGLRDARTGRQGLVCQGCEDCVYLAVFPTSWCSHQSGLSGSLPPG